MRVTVLGTGSGGNATLVESGDTRVLVDAGFSGRNLERRLDEVGVEAASLDALVVTHEHGDHTRGVGVLARRHGTPVHLTPVTRRACAALLLGGEDVRPYAAGVPFRIGRIEVSPFLTAHDAADPVAITLRDLDSGDRLGIAMDLGRPTAGVRHALAACHLLVLEANHDEVLLREGPYPWSVKQRIASSHGHLSNGASARLARELHHEDLVAVVLAHLSDRCNVPSLAEEVVGSALEAAGWSGVLAVGRQDRPIPPIDVAALRRRRRPEQLGLGLTPPGAG